MFFLKATYSFPRPGVKMRFTYHAPVPQTVAPPPVNWDEIIIQVDRANTKNNSEIQHVIPNFLSGSSRVVPKSLRLGNAGHTSRQFGSKSFHYDNWRCCHVASARKRFGSSIITCFRNIAIFGCDRVVKPQSSVDRIVRPTDKL